METDLFPVALLIDELKNDDVQLQLNSIRRLKTIALALGEERTRRELVPFLGEESKDDEDSVLQAIAEELGDFVPLVGGAAHAPCLLPVLESVATVEETVVREAAVDSLCKVCAALSEASVADHFVPLLKRLAAADFWTARVSACGLFASAYASTAAQQELRALFASLARDETPMVRRAVAQHLGKFAAAVAAPELLQSALLPVFSELTLDEQDSVRLIAVEDCAVLARLLPREASVSTVLPIMLRFAADKSWRVRYAVAQNLYGLCEVLGPTGSGAELPAYVRLLRDGEAEVRIAAASKVASFCELAGGEAALQQILPCVTELASDANPHVRAVLAGVIAGAAPVLGKAATVEGLLPLFLLLLKDESAEVRLNIIGKLEALNTVVGVDMLSASLLPAVVELAEDRHWRVRLALIEYIPALAAQLGLSFFEDKLTAQCLSWLSDSVHAVREAAALNLRRLAEAFGVEWAALHLVPQVLALAKSPHYLYRATVLQAVGELAPVLGAEFTCTSLLPAVITSAHDRVPNIRFATARLLGSLAPLLGPAVCSATVRPCLVELEADADPDVRSHAQSALLALPT